MHIYVSRLASYADNLT